MLTLPWVRDFYKDYHVEYRESARYAPEITSTFRQSVVFEPGPKVIQQPDIYLRNFETSRKRCDRVEQTHREEILELDRFDEKLRGPIQVKRNMRKQEKTMEKHLPIKLGEETDEA